HSPAERAENVSAQPRGRRLAIDAGDRDDRNTSGASFAEHHIDDRVSHRTWSARRRRQVHSQTRSGVDFDNYASLNFQRTRNVTNDHIDTADVEAHCLGSIYRAGRNFWMNEVSDVRRRSARAQIRVATNQHSLAGRRNGFWLEIL